MATNEMIRRKFQSGTESVRGTAVAATRIVYADISQSYDRPLQEFPDRSGTYISRRRPVNNRPTVGFSGSDMLTFEDILLWMQLGVKNVASGVSDSGTPTPGYTWDFTPSAEVDDLASWTLEHGEPGNVYESDQFMLNSWTMRINPDSDGAWMWDFQALARNWESSTYTGSIPQRETEVIRAPGTKVYLDSSTIGTTQQVGKIIDFSLSCNLNLHMKAFMENDTSWAKNRVGRQARTFDAVMTVEFDDDVEFANFRADTPVKRKIRVEREGSTIHTTVKKKAQIDLYGYYNAISFGDREGNMTAQFAIQGFYDSTAATDCKFSVVNTLAKAPGDV